MTIDNIPDDVEKIIDTTPGTESARKCCIFALVVLFVISLLLTFVPGLFPPVKHAVELIQAVLLCSTALMGLTGIMLVETKKTEVGDLPSGVWQLVPKINRINSLARALVFLRWSFWPALFAIGSGLLWLMYSLSFFMVSSIIGFAGQLYFLVWALTFSEVH